MKSVENITRRAVDLENFKNFQDDIMHLQSKLIKTLSEPFTVRDDLLRGAYVDLDDAITKLQTLRQRINKSGLKSWIAESGNSIRWQITQKN